MLFLLRASTNGRDAAPGRMNGDGEPVVLAPPPPAFPPKGEGVAPPTTRIPGVAPTGTGTTCAFALPNVPSSDCDGGLANPSSSPAASQLPTLPRLPLFPSFGFGCGFAAPAGNGGGGAAKPPLRFPLEYA
jgi:hypothetical protein